jgi:hypothetical protein
MKKALSAFLLATLVAVLVLATPAFACACGLLPSAQQGTAQQGNGPTGYNPNDSCTWPKDKRPANCPAPS